MRQALALLLTLTVAETAPAQAPPPPIIDVHLHASPLAFFVGLGGPAPVPHCVPMTDYPVPDSGSGWAAVFRSRNLPCRAVWSAATEDSVMAQTLAILERRNVYAVTSGPLVARWRQASPARVIPSLSYGGPGSPSPDSMRAWIRAGRFAAIGEVGTQYLGIEPGDPALEPLWALAEELDVPVGIHLGTGPVGAPYLGFDRYRARLHSALLIEEVLVKHPRVRVNLMHAGWPMLDDLLAVLWTHPQVYVDVGVISWALPRAEFHRYLRRIVEAGFGKRVLFGSDQMVWPETVELAIEAVESADFLTAEQRRDIFFNNAVRFLRLPPDRVAAMRGRD
jgi:predicted TIM-barrel fold metal-dependent hydrolase